MLITLSLSFNQLLGPIPILSATGLYIVDVGNGCNKISPNLFESNSGFTLKNNRVSVQPTKNGDLCSIWNYDRRIAYEHIVVSTEDFDFRYCIRVDGYRSVYKAKLPCGKVVALKKLHHLEDENPTFDKRSPLVWCFLDRDFNHIEELIVDVRCNTLYSA
ncbi:hypothetical protein Gohar_010054 [Gossypium harknessii]|uniref:non-specific serine/threonine protein kinase n=1 Tax=Gossypium harknessii TaxID=34285 RepID=A0A7J9GPQ2_9ROSI|nr:hypothetical protein [Gossypium harknessii]